MIWGEEGGGTAGGGGEQAAAGQRASPTTTSPSVALNQLQQCVQRAAARSGTEQLPAHTMFSRRSMPFLMLSRCSGPTSVRREGSVGCDVMGSDWMGGDGYMAGGHSSTTTGDWRQMRASACSHESIPPAPCCDSSPALSLVDTEVEPQEPQPRVREGLRWKLSEGWEGYKGGGGGGGGQAQGGREL